ncbi:Cof-type HAD-IIB family hydrolase [Mycoplasma sp. CSL10166]|uniref:Cof-type HAD-IIB family hydrolase n=1 Tax=Mycoplasma sp. CSL10166 TaxID=2813825 RepID=UPI00197B99E4|nr:Cof-type HAD-IIB family hydrolase [Mycoplasma sp. CSL10166]MBN4084220.1 HAD family phosphatase [Mycoplasma sp. CSL10166]
MKKWVIFSDVDGTIYPFPGKVLSQVNIDKAAEIKEKGVEFVINTGNAPYEKIQRLANQMSSRYIVCSNGALIFDNLEKKVLNIEYIDTKEARKIWDLAEQVGVYLYYFGDNRYFLKDPTLEFRKFITEFCEYDNWILTGEIPDDLHKIELYGDKDKLKEFYDKAIEMNIDLNIVYLVSHIEITKPGISKGTGMKWLCDNVFGVDVKTTMAIGDSQNDISMFEMTDYSYAMANIDDYSIQFAKLHTSSVEQNGLAEAIDDYLYRTDFELKRQLSQQGPKRKK